VIKQRCPNCELPLAVIYNKCTRCGWAGFMQLEYPEAIRRVELNIARRKRM
jgi:hypothetical protein